MRIRFLAAVLVALVACGAPPPTEPPAPAEPAAAIAAVRGFQEAFERRDVAAILDHLADDVEWLTARNGTVAVQARGRDEVRAALEQYFASVPGVQTVIEESFDVGAFVAVRGRVSWRDPDNEEHTQIALAVYEVEAGKIQRAWYYPEQADNTP